MSIRACLGIALLIPGLAWSASPNPQSKDPRVGYWIEEKISTTYPQAQGLQLSFEDLGGGQIRYKLGANHTPENLIQVDAKCDGGKYPLVFGNGKVDGRMYSCRITGAHSVESLTTQLNSKTESTATVVETVSVDGNELMGIGTYRDAAGKVVREVRRHFTRRR
jgi:hypothetical protein